MEPEFREGKIVIVNLDLEAQPNQYVMVKGLAHSDTVTLRQ